MVHRLQPRAKAEGRAAPKLGDRDPWMPAATKEGQDLGAGGERRTGGKGLLVPLPGQKGFPC